MVADVRQKVAQRCVAFQDRLIQSIQASNDWMLLVAQAKHNPRAATDLRSRVRTLLMLEFPGCEIRVMLQAFSITLPSRYPNARSPVIVSIQPFLIGCFNPPVLRDVNREETS